MTKKNIQSLFYTVWFGRQAVQDGFLSPEDFASQLFEYVEQEETSFQTFAEHLKQQYLLTPFQIKTLNARLPSLPTSEETTPPEAPRSVTQRYVLEDLLKQGGIGQIYRAFDEVMQRHVAIKCLQPQRREDARKRFENEYKITARLEHPNIISVHDADYIDEIGPFYVMRLLAGRTLRDVIREAHEQETMSRGALMRMFLELCAAMTYSHNMGILHRDLKPSNVMVGELGEIQVMDWGIAKDLHREEDEETDISQQASSPTTGTQLGEIIGTPGYMSPEQAKGETLDARTDIFSLGVIFYEMLTGRLPFPGTQPESYLQALTQHPLHRPSEHVKGIDPQLDDIAMMCLSIDPDKRFSSVKELSLELIAYMEGTKMRQLRTQRAASKIAEGLRAKQQIKANEQQAQQLLREVRKEQARLRPYESLEKKRPIWSKEHQLKHLQREAVLWLGEAVSAFNQALALDPDNKEARQQLAGLYLERRHEAAEKKDLVQVAYNEAMVKRYDDGRFVDALKNQGEIQLLSDPPGATVTLHPLQEIDRRLIPQEGQQLGTTPLETHVLPAGSYLATFFKEGFVETKVPVYVENDTCHIYHGRLYKEEDLPEGFCYVPKGRFIMGGDPMTASAGQIKTPALEDLFVSTYPVTIREYLAFLNDFDQPQDAQKHVPRRTPDGGYYLECSPDGVWNLPDLDEEGDTWDPNWPTFSISYYDAEAYAKWRAQRNVMPIRLPRSIELEKAARGVDGRYHPWGDGFDPTFCKMGTSKQGPPKPEAVGTYPIDCSIYGVHDLAGTIREWCSDKVDDPQGAIAIGSSWSGSELACRAAHRWHLQRSQLASGLGFRIAMDAPRCAYHQGYSTPAPQKRRYVHIPQGSTPQTLTPSTAQEGLSSPSFWRALSQRDEQAAFAQLALIATNHGAAWSTILSSTEDIPLATAGQPPDHIQALLTASIQKTPINTELPAVLYTCYEDPLTLLALPKEHPLPKHLKDTLLPAIQHVLQQRYERQHAEQREQQAQHKAQHAQKQLTIVREAFASLAPETYLNEHYPLLDGRSKAMQRLFRTLDRVVSSDINVLVQGESGVGKERVARTIHLNGPRKEGPFVAVNCGAIPDNLVESELFGHVKGAFTGANDNHKGLFREAHMGTLFLDEVAELSLDSQVKLLRALQNRSVRPVGDTTEYPFDARIISATHEDLKARVEQGTFREDLYYRLIVFDLEVPALRQRPEDIPSLIKTFLREWGAQREVAEDTMDILQRYPWPGNIRELENELRRALVIAEEGPIKPTALSKKLRTPSQHSLPLLQGQNTLKELVGEVERQAITIALQQANGNKSKAAKQLGLSRRGLQLKLDRYGL